MCWNQPASLTFSLMGTAMAFFAYHRTGRWQLFAGLMYFVAMEFLQFVQYFWIDQCDNYINKFLTVLGVLHIFFQPFFCHLVSSVFATSSEEKANWRVIQRLCLLGAGLLALRYALGAVYYHDTNPTQEWLVGDKICTYKASWHLAWSFPAYPTGYLMQSGSLHAFLMFAPYLVVSSQHILGGLMLLAGGPLLSYALSNNPQEQPAIWCFFSILQIVLIFPALELMYPGTFLKISAKQVASPSSPTGLKIATGRSSPTEEKSAQSVL